MSRLSGAGDGLPIPQSFAILDAEGTDQTDRAVIAAAGTEDELILVDVRRHRIEAVAGVLAALHVPRGLARCGIQGDHTAVLRGNEYLAIGQAHATVRGKQQDVRWIVGRLPEQLAVARIQRKHTIMRRGQVHSAVPDNRRRLLFAVIGDTRPPADAQGADIGLVDLRQRGVAIAGVALARQDPVVVVLRGAPQYLVIWGGCAGVRGGGRGCR